MKTSKLLPLIAVLFILTVMSAYAQDSTKKSPIKTKFSLILGTNYTKLPTLNSSTQLGLSFHLAYQVGRFRFFWKNNKNYSERAKINGGFATLEEAEEFFELGIITSSLSMGYDLLKSERLALSPFVGIAASSRMMTIITALGTPIDDPSRVNSVLGVTVRDYKAGITTGLDCSYYITRRLGINAWGSYQLMGSIKEEKATQREVLECADEMTIGVGLSWSF